MEFNFLSFGVTSENFFFFFECLAFSLVINYKQDLHLVGISRISSNQKEACLFNRPVNGLNLRILLGYYGPCRVLGAVGKSKVFSVTVFLAVNRNYNYKGQFIVNFMRSLSYLFFGCLAQCLVLSGCSVTTR